MKDYTIGTKCVQAGYTPGNGEPRQIPIVQSTTFKYNTSEDMGRLFDLEAEGYFYTKPDKRSCSSKDCIHGRWKRSNADIIRSGSEFLCNV